MTGKPTVGGGGAWTWTPTRVFLDADTHRVSCPERGVVVAHVPLGLARFAVTTAFEDTTASLVDHAAATVVAVLLRIAWRRDRDRDPGHRRAGRWRRPTGGPAADRDR
jgi:hypothetical protein